MMRLELIADGGIDAAAARSILAELPRELDAEGARKLFAAFRSWTWKALDQKRRDPELREWHDVMKRAQLRTKAFGRVVAQLQVLLDLIHESLAVAARQPVGGVLNRRHAQSVISLLRSASERRLSKRVLMATLGIKDANLSRLMNVLMGAGLVERIEDGREAHYRLSRSGEEAANRWDARHQAVRPRELTDLDAADWIDFFVRRTEQVQAQVYNGLKGRRAETWIMGSERSPAPRAGDPSRLLRAVGSSANRDEDHRFGHATDAMRSIVVVRADPSGLGGAAKPRFVSPPNG